MWMHHAEKTLYKVQKASRSSAEESLERPETAVTWNSNSNRVRLMWPVDASRGQKGNGYILDKMDADRIVDDILGYIDARSGRKQATIPHLCSNCRSLTRVSGRAWRGSLLQGG